MSGINDFVVNGVITSSPDVARVELAQAHSERKAHKVYDILNICESADRFAQIFADESIARQIALLGCRDVDRFVELLDALGYEERAATVRLIHLSEHIEHQGGEMWTRVLGLPGHDWSATS
ncbi:hypothetical protein [Rhodococcus koreensis]|uniref:Uncharacterized protein n=1 Tax=Rhodococcus koreensis TaxID=99653 RepID=A0A1H4I5S4_9NOCA|nr:hypothetical protein [Rhodococcus koreensis]SEB29427.1 hypothetical protein SAMN04490239_0089 [Rhodococcus koreensis]